MHTNFVVISLQLILFILAHCFPGQFSNSVGECEACPFGTYQSDEGGANCNHCPPNYSTKFIGATHKSSCIGMLHAWAHLTISSIVFH